MTFPKKNITRKLLSLIQHTDEPKLKGPSHPDPITLTVGDNLRLNCSAEGNPEPAYTWTLPSAGGSPVTDSVLTVESVTTDHKGQYVCSVSNYMATVTVRFDVDVQGEFNMLYV